MLFKGASLAPLDYDQALAPDRAPEQPVSLYPESVTRKTTDSWGDIGAAAWQFQPAVRTMAYSMRAGESPWWNPYEATGRMFPESMVDVPFSFVTLVAASFGGSSTAITFVLLGLYFVTVFCLLRSLNFYLRLSFLASCAACAVYMLSGFTLANLNSQVGQPSLLGPALLLALLWLLDGPTTRKFAVATLAQAALFSVTFFPTMILTAFGVHAILAVLLLWDDRPFTQRIRLVAYQLAVPVLAFGLVAFLYLPIIEAVLNYTRTLTVYNLRSTPGYSLESALSTLYTEALLAIVPGNVVRAELARCRYRSLGFSHGCIHFPSRGGRNRYLQGSKDYSSSNALRHNYGSCGGPNVWCSPIYSDRPPSILQFCTEWILACVDGATRGLVDRLGTRQSRQVVRRFIRLCNSGHRCIVLPSLAQAAHTPIAAGSGCGHRVRRDFHSCYLCLFCST